MTPETTRIPPQSIEAEACVLGAMLLDAELVVDQVTPIVTPAHFYRPSHQILFEIIVNMRREGKPVDLVTVRAELEDRKSLDAAGGIDYISAFAEGVPSSANAAYYAKIVYDRWQKREVIVAATTLANKAYDPGADGAELALEYRRSIEAMNLDNGNGKPHTRLLSQLVVSDPNRDPKLIDGLIRRRELGVLVAGPKANKSWTLGHLGLCVALGWNWLNFPTVKSKVLIIDFELAPGEFSHRYQELTRAMGIGPSEVDENFSVELLRGKTLDIDHLEGYFAHIKPGTYDLVIIDPIYKLYPPGFDENDNADMGRLMSNLHQIAEDIDASIIVVHHASKGSQADKATSDIGAGAGSLTRACDVHLTIRPHKDDGAAVVSTILRSSKPLADFCIKWTFPLWELAPTLDAADLLRPKKGGRSSSAGNTKSADEPQPDPFLACHLTTQYMTDQPASEAAIMSRVTTDGKANPNSFKRLLHEAEAQGMVFRWYDSKDRRKVLWATTPQPELGENQ